MVIKRVGGEMLGKTSRKKPLDDKETWWWNDEVKDMVKAKREAKKIWEKYGQQEDKERYQRHKKQHQQRDSGVKTRAMEEGMRVMQMEVPGGRARGRPKRKGVDIVREDLRDKKLSEDDVLDRARWRKAVGNIDPT
ncbi:uncharacterized protein [Macrobrachium rosenbergii]|uniref:uncharacterized protein n=1 Tax=Macrobrachium rosenbergii TaxID=79674 RepID=UPI0034D42EDF